MAKIKQSTKGVSINMVLEDPRPSSKTIYIQGDAHDFSSLSPIFAKAISTETSGQTASGLGNHTVTVNFDQAGQPQTALFLSKGSTAVQQTTANGNDRFVNLDLQWAASLDPRYTPTGASLLSNNVSSGIMFYYHRNNRLGQGEYAIFTNLLSAQELYDAVVSNRYGGQAFGGTADGNSVVSIFPYVDPGTSRIPMLTNTQARNDLNGQPIAFNPGFMGPWPNPTTALTRSALQLVDWWGQLIGISPSGNILYLANNTLNDNQQRIVYSNLNDNSTSYNAQYSTVRAAFAGSAGGTRSTASGIRQQFKMSSSLFDDPDLADTKGFYCPYFDVNNNFQPYYFQWNTVTDVFTRNEDVSVETEADSGVFFTSSTFFNDLTANAGTFSRWSSAVFNETFTFTQGQETTRFLILGAINGRHAVHDDSPVKRTFITFEIDSADPKKLIYHSQFTAPSTPRNIVWLNDSKTLLGVFYFNTFIIYNFVPATGWVEAQVVNEQFWAVGRDRIDRIWGVANASNSGFGDLHLITPALPVTIVITPENETYNYQGVTINTFVQLEAFNVQGNRIEADVTLVIDGPTFAFGNDSKSQVVRTSSTGSVTVPIKITDSGFSQIIASVTI